MYNKNFQTIFKKYNMKEKKRKLKLEKRNKCNNKIRKTFKAILIFLNILLCKYMLN